MPLYYLHLRHGTRVQVDPDGVDLPAPEAARAEALRVIAELWDDLAPHERSGMAFEIAEDTGEIALTVPFQSS